ncbi:MAG TPA: uroporphyrinogen decarboxylase family protein [Ramlibacter sp.]|nr:uroporphyrinogen decarboxylase family protein [Ramlibacter sp.]
MNRRQRLEAAVTGGQPDRVPVSAWGHFYPQETSAQGLADVMLDFFQRYDWDFLKVHARASYHVEGWGFSYEPSHDPVKLHVCTGHPIASAQSWRKLEALSMDTPALQEQIQAIRLIRARLPDDAPLIMTVFSPLDSAEKLVDRNAALLKAHIDEAPDAVEQGLAAIADTFERFMKLLVAEGVDGIYFSTKWANNAKLTSAQYQRLVRPFDLQVLEPARSLWCNILHLCEDAVQLQAMADYPVQVFHWDEATPNNPKLVDGQRLLGKAVGGGVDAPTLARGTPEEILAKARGVIRAQEGRNLVLGPGCSVQVAATSDANLRALRQAVEL